MTSYKTLSIDIETYSPIPLKETGVYPYAEEVEILLFAYKYGDEDVKIIDLTAEDLPVHILKDLVDPLVLKYAYNANFERICINTFFGINSPVEQWYCTQVQALSLGLPGHLKSVAEALKLEKGKMEEGLNLIRYFSIPCKPAKVNNGRTRNLPEHAPDKWQVFKDYCVRDVEVETSIRNILAKYEVNEFERQLYILDQKINDRGVNIDMELVENAIRFNAEYTRQIASELRDLSGIKNVNSTVQIKEWLAVDGLTKNDVSELLQTEVQAHRSRTLEIRQELAKTSIAKYRKMRNCICADGRIRGLFQFYGANRTGRWAGRLVQVQNLPRNTSDALDQARQILKSGDLEEFAKRFKVPDMLSQLVRTAFVGPFIVVDFSAIEARVIAWLAKEEWRLEVFETHGKIYEASAAAMFKIPIEEVTKEMRQKGKIAELALGYQGSIGALKQMGALEMGLREDELPDLVLTWRSSNKRIMQFWWDVETSFKRAFAKGYDRLGNLRFIRSKSNIQIVLPSGRSIWYLLVRHNFEDHKLSYMGLDQTTRQWKRMETYGGKLVENIVQAVARDCLGEAMLALDNANYPIVMHIHDEIVIEMEGKAKARDLKKVLKIITTPPAWAVGLPLSADGFVSDYYKKE